MDVNGPFVNMENVGAGGGSIAWLTDVGELRVGPESAGSNPGPVCYDRGGERPTVTDADLLLGLLDPSDFAGGQFDLDATKAQESIRTHIAEPLGVSPERAALMIRNVIDNKMAGAINVVSIEEGFDLRDFVLVGFGGAGPMHACNVAEELGIETVVFPNKPGLFSALGMLTTDIKHEYVRSVVETVDAIDRTELNETVARTVARGDEELATERIDPEDRSFEISLDLMYTGQSHSINVPVSTVADPDSATLSAADLEGAAEAFEQRHEENYGFTDEENSIELLNVRITAHGATATPAIEPQRRDASLEEARHDRRAVRCDADTTVTAPCYEWESVGTDHNIDGPAILEMDNSTVWIPPSFDAEVTPDRHIIARGVTR
jgi:N-methylhydantoinase A